MPFYTKKPIPIEARQITIENADELAAWIADYAQREYREYLDGYTSYRYETIDADIRNMKSFSESTKMRMFIERKARRKQEQHSSSVLGRIQVLMKEV
jgi:hypothetical protein